MKIKSKNVANIHKKCWHFLKTVCILCTDYLCSWRKFEIYVFSCTSQQNSFPNIWLLQNKSPSKEPKCNDFRTFFQSLLYTSREVHVKR